MQLDLWSEDFSFASALSVTITTNVVKAPPPPCPAEAEAITQIDSPAADDGESEVELVADMAQAINAMQVEEDIPTRATSPIETQVTSQAARQAIKAVSTWAPLTTEAHAGLSGTITKFDANVQAIELLRNLETENRTPTEDERKTLHRYTGWGGIKNPFDYHVNADWVDRTKKLKDLLTEDEFASAKESTLNAHFTPLEVTQQVWSAIAAMGFTGGRVLEPSAGIGYFLGTMPQEMVQNSEVTAIELDSLSARMLGKLYGEHATVIHSGFEAVELPEGYFDLVVSNVPFGNYQVSDLRRKPYSDWSIHNYFIARAMELVRPGGIVAVITSAFFMDAYGDLVRSYVARKGKLVGAIRMPARTFSAIADTDVVADIIILQRRLTTEVATPAELKWVATENLVDEAGVPVTYAGYRKLNYQGSSYWNANPTQVIGTWTETTRAHSMTVVPVLRTGESLLPLLADRIEALPKAIYLADEAPKVTVDLTIQNQSGLLPGAFVMDGGDIMRQHGFGKEKTDLTGIRAKRVAAMIGIRDTVRALIAEQSSVDASDSKLNSLRYKLNVLYDALVKQYGPIGDNGNRKVMSSDPYWPLMLSLEIYDEASQTTKKADIFSERTTFSTASPEKADTVEDALAISLAELGCVDAQYMSRLTGREAEDVLAELVQTGQLFIDPHTRNYVSAGEYLSGNVREKLAIAARAGIVFDSNVKALEKAIPADLLPTQIDVMLGAVWIPQAVYEEFARNLVGNAWDHIQWAGVKVINEPTSGSWSLDISGPIPADLTTKWGTLRLNGFELLGKGLNQADPEVLDKDIDGKYFTNVQETAKARLKLDELKAEFIRWLWSDDSRAKQLAREYNDRFNCWAIRKFDGSKLRLPGYSHVLKLREHQLNAIARAMTGDNTLLYHVVGAGKSVTMICASMEQRRLGISKKPVHVVPNHMLMQYTAEFLRAYPNAKVLMATADDFKKERRREFIARCATGDWDCIVLTHSMFERVGADPELSQDMIETLLLELKAQEQNRNLDRAASRAVKKQAKDWKARLDKLNADWKKDKLISLKEMGIDALFFDECHVAKNLFRISNMKQIAGLPNNNSQRAFDILLKTVQIQRQRGDKEKGLVFASGTAISNSIAELHVMQRYLQPFTLQAMGLDKFDAWAAQFGRAVNSMEVSPDGSSFRMNRRFKQFVNMPELMGMFRQVADIQTKEMLNLPVPKLVSGKPMVCEVPASEQVKEYVKKLVERAEAIRNKLVKPDEDNMLAITGDGQKVALDYRLVHPSSKFDPENKVGHCVRNVFAIWQKTAGFKGTQIVFSDMGTPTGHGLDLYSHMRDMLVEMGIPAHEIAFIHEADTDAKKATLFAKMRAGVVRVLFASTQKGGVGTNVQTLLYAVHHLTTPWRPSDVEQRDGRIERQGNTCPEIEIWRYVTSGSFDAYMWQTLSAKAGFIAQVMAGNAEVRTVEDAMVATLTYDEVKALACGNPRVREKAAMDAEIMELTLKKRQHGDSVWNAKQSLWKLPMVVQEAKASAVAYSRMLAKLKDASANQGSPLRLAIQGKVFTDVETIEKILTLSIAEFNDTKGLNRSTLIGTLNGMDLFYKPWGTKFEILAAHEEDLNHVVDIGGYARGSNLIKAFLEKLEVELEKKVATLEGRANYYLTQKTSLEEIAGSAFAHEERLNTLIARTNEIAVELGMLKDMAGTDGMAEGQETKSKLAGELASEGMVDEAETQEEVTGEDEAAAEELLEAF